MMNDDLAFRSLRYNDQTHIDRKEYKLYSVSTCNRHGKGRMVFWHSLALWDYSTKAFQMAFCCGWNDLLLF